MTKLLMILAMLGLASAPAKPTPEEKPNDAVNIQVALLLDTSNSMDGMIDQAKSQLWKMVNQLATTKKDGKIPNIEIALYEYGKSSLSASDGYVRQIVPLTTDLDKISEELFAVKTNGGDEYCGWVIRDAVKNLKWSKSNNDLKMIIIAGNEEFTQGTVDYKEACKTSITNGIVVNTIFCGNCDEGVRIMWKDGADRADGKYMCINTNDAVVHVPTPYDDEILKLNTGLNDTYIPFNSSGKKLKERQVLQDVNAESYGAANMAQRAASKSSAAYKNDEWDIVDALESDKDALKKADKEELPKEWQGLTDEQIKAKVEETKKKREEIQAQIRDLNAKAEQFRIEESKKNQETNTLDNTMLKAMKEQAEAKGFNNE